VNGKPHFNTWGETIRTVANVLTVILQVVILTKVA
jgi:hypothetical protein